MSGNLRTEQRQNLPNFSTMCLPSRFRLKLMSRSVVGVQRDLELATAHHAAKCRNLAHGIARVFAVIVTMLRLTEPTPRELRSGELF